MEKGEALAKHGPVRFADDGREPARRGRVRLAVRAATTVNGVSRRLGLGNGTVAGGRVALEIAPHLISSLTAARPVAVVSGTNGKTTTTGLLVAALSSLATNPSSQLVVTNNTGSNMTAGHAAALAQAAAAGNLSGPVVLETDEGYLPSVLADAKPVVVVLLNLSRDQLDRTNEVRMTASRWRGALAAFAGTVVANCDDPLVVWGCNSAPRIIWVAAGAKWLADAVGCPACAGRLVHSAEGWSCRCGFARPAPDVELCGSAQNGQNGQNGQSAENVQNSQSGFQVAWTDGRRLPVQLSIPGHFNLANGAMAAVAAEVLGVPAAQALAAMGRVQEIAGRFAVRTIDGVTARLLLAKNPAGWLELLELVRHDHRPLVIGINARVADGRDPSWLWDVPFEDLRGRQVVATGERCWDLAVRLRYAEVAHRAEADPRLALRLANELDTSAPIDFIGNYTAFHDLWQG